MYRSTSHPGSVQWLDTVRAVEQSVAGGFLLGSDGGADEGFIAVGGVRPEIVEGRHGVTPGDGLVIPDLSPDHGGDGLRFAEPDP